MNICLDKCRGCCKFKDEEVYLAPKVTDKEIERIKEKGLFKPVFRSFQGSKKVFQIDISKSTITKDRYVCPYLDEATQMCKIYSIRPFDCEFWPFMLTYDKIKKNVQIIHFNKDVCPITKSMTKIEFKNYLKKDVDKWINERDIIALSREYPELVWEFEKDTLTLKVIGEVTPIINT